MGGFLGKWASSLLSVAIQICVGTLIWDAIVGIAFRYGPKTWTSSRLEVIQLKRRSWICCIGCTDGIGLGMLTHYAQNLREHQFLVFGRSESRLSEVAALLSKFGHKAETVMVDFDSEQSDAMASEKSDVIERVREALMGKDICLFINAIGQSYPRPMFYNEIDESFLDRLVNVNLKSVFLTTRIVVQHMLKGKQLGASQPGFSQSGVSEPGGLDAGATQPGQSQEGGHIVLFGSIAPIAEDPLASIYVATKAGISSFARSLQAELRAYKVVVHCFEPSWVQTKMIQYQRNAYGVISVEDFVSWTAKTSARTRLDGLFMTPVNFSPHPLHALIYLFLRVIPTSVRNSMRLRHRVSTRQTLLHEQRQG